MITMDVVIPDMPQEAEQHAGGQDWARQFVETIDKVFVFAKVENWAIIGSPEGEGFKTVTDALKTANIVLKRLRAPCPQCHAMGDRPGCTSLQHHLPDEARKDIDLALRKIQEVTS